MTGLFRIFWVSVLVFLIDQASKWYVVESLDLIRIKRLDVWPPYLNLRMAWNKGVNFGLMDLGDDGGQYFLVALSLVLVIAVLIWLRNAQGWLAPISAGLIVGGAIGNVVDRINYGAVADFLNMSCCEIVNPFSFNVADIAIFAGVFGLLIFGDGKPEPAAPVQSDNA